MKTDFKELIAMVWSGDLSDPINDQLENVIRRCEAAEHYIRLCWQFTKGPELIKAHEKWAGLAGPENTETITLKEEA